MFPGLQPSRRELTPVRLCSVRLSWRQRARPSTTLHEIQICRSRLEYFVCITAGGGPQLGVEGAAEVVSTRCDGVSVLEVVEKKILERFAMKGYLKFAAGFWVSAFLVAGSMASAQSTSTTTAKAKKSNTSSTTSSAPAANSGSSGQTTSGTTSANSTQP